MPPGSAAVPGPGTPRYCTLWPPSPARRPTMASQLKLLATRPALWDQGSASTQGAGRAAGRCPVSEVPAPCGLLREVACRLPACVSVYFLLFCFFVVVFFVFWGFFFLSFYFFFNPPKRRVQKYRSREPGRGEGMMDGSGSRPPAPCSGVSKRAPGPSGTGSGASAGGPRHLPHRRPRPHLHLPRTTSCPV